MEKPFDILPGVIATTSGYTGGVEANPRYHDVGGGKTGHRESGAFFHLITSHWSPYDRVRVVNADP